ncbi:MAG: ATP-binding protein [Candidatus Sulfotelmatobacter sp.]
MESSVTNRLVALLAAVSRGTAETTILDLFDTLELPTEESTLAKVIVLKDRIAGIGLRMTPDFDRGELDSVRRIQFLERQLVPEKTARSELLRREAVDLELKSSLLFDHKRAANDPNASASDLRSDGVLHSCLKTVAAFLTSGGGVLYVGVDDCGAILGLEFDFRCMTDKPERQNSDGWELTLRDYVKGRFKEGESINDYLDCQIMSLDDKLVARLEVASRKRLSFLKGKDGFVLFRRQGNRTEQVQIDQVEEFIESSLRNIA